MAIVEMFAATHDSGARYTPFNGSLKVGEYIRVVGRVDETWVHTNTSKQGCVRVTDVDDIKSIKFGRSEYNTVDLCGYNRDRKATEGKNLFVVFVYAKPEHVGCGIHISARCVNPVGGETRIVVIPVTE